MLVWKNKKVHFEETALPHLNALYRFALHLSGNEADAEDLAQECFHQAYRKFHQFKKGTNCRAWLFKIARNAHIDRLRRKAREFSVMRLPEELTSGRREEGWMLQQHRQVERLAQDPAGAIEDEEVFFDLFGDEVNQFLSKLPLEFRLTVVLCDVEGFNYNEIGEILGCPIGTVRSRISRARTFLREALYDYAKSLGYVRSDQ